MLRIDTQPRKHWQQQAQSLGFHFHTLYGEPYWDETAYYRFSLRQIEDDIEAPTEEIHQMCLQLVDKAVHSEQLMERLAIPEHYWELIRDSWLQGDPHLYGRMDFSYDGKSPAKFYEYNADTPTSLYESAYFQWCWLEDRVKSGHLPATTDQFNCIQEMLIEVLVLLKRMHVKHNPLYFSCCKDSEEDYGTTTYFRDCAAQAGLKTAFIAIDDIGISPDGCFTDKDDMTIPALFKLYPWEFMFEDAFGHYLPSRKTLFVEPPWKALLSNKAILPLLWEAHKGHPNLLPSYFDDQTPEADLGSHFVKKPVFSREGANISVIKDCQQVDFVDGPYDDSGYILQQFHPLPVFSGNHTLLGSWVIGDRAAGVGIREDKTVITKDTSRFLPHIIA